LSSRRPNSQKQSDIAHLMGSVPTVDGLSERSCKGIKFAFD
jgi:hypothetical protein